jgi:CxxC motif-containing protein (DUF1111 family)
MDRSRAAAVSFFGLVAGTVCWSAPAWGADAKEGEGLFRQEFVPGVAATVGGDGLGPVFNHRSCAACHSLGGLGGAGPIDVNVVMLSAQPGPQRSRPTRNDLLKALEKAHPGFVPGGQPATNILLHRFGLHRDYDALRKRLAGEGPSLAPTESELDELQRELSRRPIGESPKPPPFLRLVLSQRNTTALFGAGIIDQIPDAALATLAAAQQGEVSGRVPPVGPHKVGRFGWRGQIERLHDFVLGACANELGLQVPGTDQPIDPLRPEYRPTGLDLTSEQCASLTTYVASLPAPKFVPPAEPLRRELVEQGRKTFQSIGCTACHVEKLGPVDGLFSDLLLHDMGSQLADPVPAQAALVAVGEPIPAPNPLLVKSDGPRPPKPSQLPQPLGPQGYYGGSSQFAGLFSTSSTVRVVDSKTGEQQDFRVQRSNLDQEWRTPPLWGLADSAPYLHDGRAATVIEAIALHGGEAEPCTKRFLALSIAERMSVLEFLSCLKAP